MTPSKRAHLSIQGIYKWHQMPMNKKKRETRKKKKKKKHPHLNKYPTN